MRVTFTSGGIDELAGKAVAYAAVVVTTKKRGKVISLTVRQSQVLPIIIAVAHEISDIRNILGRNRLRSFYKNVGTILNGKNNMSKFSAGPYELALHMEVDFGRFINFGSALSDDSTTSPFNFF